VIASDGQKVRPNQKGGKKRKKMKGKKEREEIKNRGEEVKPEALEAFRVLFAAMGAKKEKIEGILGVARKNLERGQAVATGIGIFAAVYTENGKVLLRVRTEKDSLYGKDLSGRPELPGGGVDIEDFELLIPGESLKYTSVVFNTLRRELQEETGLLLQQVPELKMYPAWLLKEPLIDLAFVIPVELDCIKETEKYWKLRKKGLLRFFSKEELRDANIISPRMRFLIESAFFAIQE